MIVYILYINLRIRVEFAIKKFYLLTVLVIHWEKNNIFFNELFILSRFFFLLHFVEIYEIISQWISWRHCINSRYISIIDVMARYRYCKIKLKSFESLQCTYKYISNDAQYIILSKPLRNIRKSIVIWHDDTGLIIVWSENW